MYWNLPERYSLGFTELRKPITVEEVPFIRDRTHNPLWTEEMLRTQIHALGQWQYYFEFSHGLTTKIEGTFNDGTILFHRFRSKLISETVVDLLGGTLGESTLLDLGSHCGLMSLDMAYRGAKFVHGVEYRRQNLNQAEFLKQYYHIDNTAFTQGDATKLTPEAYQVDVVLCLGLLYHVVSPIELIEYCYNTATKFAVIDTVCHHAADAGYRLVRNKSVASAIEGTRSYELQPTHRGVVETMQAVGFRHVVEVIGEADVAVPLYSNRERCCFIGFK